MKLRSGRIRAFSVVVGLLGTLTIACGVALVVSLPAAAAAMCPSCYGFEHAVDDTFVEKGISAEQRAALVVAVATGRQRVQRFWGKLESDPKVLVCSSDACFQRVRGGHRRGMSIFDFVAVLSPRGGDPVIAAHELSMNELNHRVGPLGFMRQAVPVWFNEGIAMYASDDLRYLAPTGTGDRCLVQPDRPLPGGMFEWNRLALTDKKLYATAACVTSQWIALHGGPSAAVAVVSMVASGVDFRIASR